MVSRLHPPILQPALTVLTVALSMVQASWTWADPLGGEPPPPLCCPNAAPDADGVNSMCNVFGGESQAGLEAIGLSLTEGNLSERVPIMEARSAYGTTSNLYLTYNSYLADGSQGSVMTVLGRGWTHSHNLFLIPYKGNMFLIGPTGRTTKFRLNPNGSFTGDTGHFDTLTKNPDGSYRLRTRSGMHFLFKKIAPAPPFIVQSEPLMLTEVEDRNGNKTVLTYVGGLLKTVQDAAGRVFTFNYNADKRIQTVIDPLGRITTFTYSGTGSMFLRKVKNPLGRTQDYDYNNGYQMIRKTDYDGRATTYQYNTSRKPISVRDQGGATRMSVSNPQNWAVNKTDLLQKQERNYVPSTTTKTDGNGKTWKYTYDSNGYITKEEGPDGGVTTYTYDPATLRVASRTNTRGHTTTYQYDGMGNLTKTTDPLGHVTQYTYEPVFNRMTSMTDPSGSVTTYVYDANGNKTSETDPLGHTQQWTYDSRGNVLTDMDKRGFTTTYTYDGAGNRVGRVDALGNASTYTYDGLGRMTSATDPLGHTTQYVYDAHGRMTRMTDPAGKHTVYDYDGAGHVVRVTDRLGHILEFVYDFRSRLTQMKDPLGAVTAYTYDGNGSVVTETNKNGHTTTYVYDTRSYRVSRTEPTGGVTASIYDSEGNLLTITDANGHTMQYTYDALNRVVQRVDPLGHTVRYEYDVPHGGCCGMVGKDLVTKVEDGAGKVTYFHYDALGALIRAVRKEGDTSDIIDPSDAVTTHTRDANGNISQTQEPNGLTRTYVYDALDRVTSQSNGAGEITSTAYDGDGRIVTRGHPTGQVVTYTYDSRDRLISVTDLLGPMSSYSYDDEGRMLSRADGNGHATSFAYDAASRLTTKVDAEGYATQYAYDSMDNLVTTTDRMGNTTTYTYDAGGRLVGKVDALGHSTQYTYDAVGNVTSMTDANGNSTTYAYDGMNRTVKETFADGKEMTYQYNPAGLVTLRTDTGGITTTFAYNDLYQLVTRDYPVDADAHYTYDLSGRMLTAVKGGWVISEAYDGADRVVSSTQNGQAVHYVYDTPGRTRRVTYPGGREILERYDVRGRLTSVEEPAGGALLTSYAYDLGDRVMTRSNANGTVTSHDFSAIDKTTRIEHEAGGTLFAGFAYGYDLEGNKTSEENLTDPTRSEAYQLDPLYRLIGYDTGLLVGNVIPLPVLEVDYGLDSVGNWNSKTTGGVPEARAHNVMNEVTLIGATGISHDAQGNLTDDGSYAYAYDEEQRLVEVVRKSDNQVVGVYSYDALSRRVVQISNPSGVPVETRFVYDRAREIEEQDGVGATRASYIYGTFLDEPVAMDRAGSRLFYHSNALWSVVALTDGAGAVVERYSYDASGSVSVTDGAGVAVSANGWGTPHSAVGNPYLFTGRRLDEEAGLYHYRARFYDPVKGRFLQRDPVGYADGPNLYEYANSAPTSHIDPWGLNGEFVKQGSWFRQEGDDGHADGSVIKTPSGNEWRKNGDTWEYYKRKPPEPPKKDPEPPQADPPNPDPPPAAPPEEKKPEGCEQPGCPDKDKKCPVPEPEKKDPPKPPEVKPPKPPLPPLPPKQPKPKKVVVIPPPVKPPNPPQKPRTAADWLEEKTKEYADANGLDYNDPVQRQMAQQRALAGAKAGGMTIPEAIGELGGIAKKGAPSPGVSGGGVTQAIGEFVKWLWGP